MGSLFRISVYAASESAAKTATNAAFARVETLNQICSDYLPESELTRLSRNGGMIVSADLFDVIQRSQHISQITGGAFDITVGHLTNLWRRSKRKGTLPTIEQLTEAKSLTDWECIKLDAKSQRITLTKSRMQLDLGGIAKGYAADAALKVLAAHGITSAAVAASGDFAIGDAPPGEQGWEISLRTFEAPEATDQLFKLRLQHCGVSTSGDLHQFIEIGGQRYSHIADPKTGLGLTRRIACTVIAPDAASSDAFATALCVLGVENGGQLLKTQPGIHARFVMLDATGGAHSNTSPGFPVATKAK